MWWLEKPALGDFYFEVSTNRFAIGFGQSARPRLNEFLPREALRFLLTAASSNKKLEFSMVNRLLSHVNYVNARLNLKPIQYRPRGGLRILVGVFS